MTEFVIKTNFPARCPECDADMDGGEIPEEFRHNYAPPYRWGRCIAVVDPNKDAFSHWQCPDCKHEWR